MNSNKIIANIQNKTATRASRQLTLHNAAALSLCVATLVLAGCNAAPKPLNSPVVAAPVSHALVSPVSGKPAAPTQGMTTVTGIAISGVTKRPLVGSPVYLAEVFRRPGDPPDAEGGFLLDVSHSPSAITDTTGRFSFINIPAKEYVMVIGDPYSTSEVVPKEDGKPRLFLTKPDNLMDVGKITVKF